ncbi:sarcosine oxidase subunit delta [Dethiosulfatarculus sandiegensis]|uniref:sarcosine oxidase subunit delta n=1 Tax=Dethiosulfatarculus sandiegensis TaxID=1429043 RepID=UPI0005C94CFD|nr:sarcosine oxidase subunit delta [Dethiosulfatarculus sandiegensis]
MGFMINCPNCGARDVYEFKFGGEVKVEPRSGADLRELRDYIYFNQNKSGVQEEWWWHQACGTWLKVTRNTETNQVLGVTSAGVGGE